MNIEFIENIESLNVFNYRIIERWVHDSVNNEGLEIGDLTFVFMSDEELLDYNIRFLDHDYYTDVITFDNSKGKVVNGDILISWERILDNANSLNTDYLSEFLRVIIHGVLHLCGYKDKEEKDIKIMREKENFYLNRVEVNDIVSRETLK